MKVLEGSEEVDGRSLKREQRMRKVFETKTPTFLRVKFRP
jgi:hypothetical protein